MMMEAASSRRPVPPIRNEHLRPEECAYKDGCPENTHPLNAGAIQERIPLFEAYLRFAELLALRSTDGMQKVGCLIVSYNLERVLGIGYNGGASGIDDELYKPEGRSGYIH